MLTQEEFSIRLKAALDQKKMKQTDLASAIGVSTANISNYMRGKAYPPIDILTEIVKTLDISLDWLCGTEKQTRGQAQTIGEIASSIVCVLESLPLECELETITIKENQQCGVKEYVDGYGTFPIYEEVEVSVPAMVFKCGEIHTFLEDLLKMRKLLTEKTFDRGFYERWINDRIQSLNELPTFSYEIENLPF